VIEPHDRGISAVRRSGSGGRWTPRRRLAFGLLLAVATGAGAALLEGATRLLARTATFAALRRSAAEDPFWDGRHPLYGVWHRPGVVATHKTPCFEVSYRTNSVGARDIERRRGAARPRVLVLGDSYVEGWGLPLERRVTSLLEQSTGLEHINLAMSHFGPYQEYLVYRTLGQRYRHDYVLIGVTPFNDFYDLDFEIARSSPSYLYRYRPYLVGTYPAYDTVDYRESPIHRLFRRNSYAYNALSLAFYWLVDRGEGFDNPAGFRHASGLVHSFYYDFRPRQFDLLRYCLERIVEEARGRRVAVVLLPAPPDFLRYDQSGDSPLSRELTDLAAARGFELVDLLPAMHGATLRWDEYYFSCDFHWNSEGNTVAARLIEEALEGTFYRGARLDRPGPRGAP